MGGNEAKTVSECLLLKWNLGVKFPDPTASPEHEGVRVYCNFIQVPLLSEEGES